MTDPDNWDLCPDCPHPGWEHDILEGCEAIDDLGNRCACKLPPP